MDIIKTRTNKSNKILSIIKDFIGSDISNKWCLDVGCSNGIISNHIGKHVYKIFGIDINGQAILEGKKTFNISVILGSGSLLPFPDDSFDIIICAQVYEHIDSPFRMASEIHRVLKDDGICFFSGPNKYAYMEEHYWLPFLSWFPRGVSSKYMKLFKKGDYYDPTPLSYYQTRKLLKNFRITDYSIELIKRPKKYSMDHKYKPLIWLSKIPIWILRPFVITLPNFNFILEKHNGKN